MSAEHLTRSYFSKGFHNLYKYKIGTKNYLTFSMPPHKNKIKVSEEALTTISLVSMLSID